MASRQAIKNMQDPIVYCKVYSIRLCFYWIFLIHLCADSSYPYCCTSNSPLHVSSSKMCHSEVLNQPVYWVSSVWCHHIMYILSCKNLTLPFTFCCSLYFTTVFLHTHAGFWNFPCTKILGTSKSSFLLTVLRWMYTLLMISNPALTNIFPKTSVEK
jgi:hypothetical protein